MLHLTAEADYDWHHPLVLGYRHADGRIEPESDSFEAETAIFLTRSLPAGMIGVVANDEDCEGTVTIEVDVEVDVVFSSHSGDCKVSTTGSHPPGSVDHPEPRTAMSLIVPVDARVRVRALDPVSAMKPVQRDANDRGEVLGIEVAPGRYEATVSVDGKTLVSRDIALKLGQDWVFNLRVLPDDIPSDCDDIPESDCEAAAAEAYAWGVFFAPGQRVTGVRVAPTRFRTCDGIAAAAFDVFFSTRNPSGMVDASVGRLPDGRLSVCTY